MTPRKYMLHLPAGMKAAIFVPLVVLLLVPVFLLSTLGTAPRPPAPPVVVFFLPAVISLLVLAQVGFTPFEIEATADRHLRFRSMARTQTLRIETITSIAPLTGKFGFLVVTHHGGKVKIPTQFTGLHTLLTELEKEVPGLQLLGC